MPMLIQREWQANTLSVDKAKQIFDECITEWGDKSNFRFNPMVKHADVFMKPRASYMAEVLRQLAEISADKGTVAVVDHEMLPFIEHAWQNDLPKKLRSLESMLRQPVPQPKDPKNRETYLEFVEKQAILDVLFEPYVQKSFI